VADNDPDDLLDAALAEAWRSSGTSSVLGVLQALGYPIPEHWVTQISEGDDGVIAGPSRTRYGALTEIARGGMGVVLRGRDVDLGRDVAMKILRPDRARNTEVLSRFIEEAQIGGQLQHPGIVPIYDMGVREGGQAYFTMKLIEGETLADLVSAATPEQRSDRRFLRVYEQLCETIAYAHSRGVIHRDLKPQNVMVGAFGEVQVVDWGLAKVLGNEPSAPRGQEAEREAQVHTVRSDSAGTGSIVGSVIGTPAYMPREQALGDIEAIGKRADVFSLGATLCEILTGKPPYVRERGDLVVQAGKADLQDAYARLEACGAHPELVALCRRCLSREVADRPVDAGAVAEAIAAHFASRDEHARRAQIAAARAEVEVREERRRRRLTVALGAAVVAGIAITAGLWWSFQKQDLERVQANTLAVRDAVAEAARLETEARAATEGGLARWEQANIASQRAADMARTVEVSLAVRDDALGVAERIAAERAGAAATAEQAARDQALREQLEELRTRAWNASEFAYLDAAYARAFEGHGIDVETDDPQAAAAGISASAIAEDLIVALDTWASAKRRQGEDQQAAARQLQRLAAATDPSAWSRSVRDAATARDAEALHALAETVETISAPDALRLANGLAEAVSAREGAEFLARHQPAHADAFWVNFQLGRWLADEQLEAADPVRALAYLRAAQALRPDDTETLRHLGLALAGVGQEEEALAVWRRALKEDPLARRVHVDLLQLLRKRGELEQHVAVLQEALASGQGRAQDYVILGASLASLRRSEDARAAFSKALELDPDHPRATRGLAWCLMQVEKPREASVHLEKYLATSPSDWLAWCWLATTRRALGQRDKMLAAAQSAVRAGPDVPQAHLKLFEAQVARDDIDGAIEAYRGLAERFPEHPSLLRIEVRIAEKLARNFRHPEAVRMAEPLVSKLQAELARSETPWAVHDDLATVLSQCLGRIDEAIEHQKRGGEMQAGATGKLLPPTLGDLGYFHRMKGDHAGGLPYWRALIEAVPKQRTARPRQHLAQSLMYLGRLPEALKLLEETRPLIADPKLRGFCDGALGAGLLWTGRIEQGMRILRDYAACCGEDELALYSPERWQADFEAMARLAPDAAAILDGTRTIDDPLDKQRFAHLCMLTYHFRDAAHLYQRIMAEHPEMIAFPSGFDLGSTLRADAAHSLVFAGLGHGVRGGRDPGQCLEAAGLLRAESRAKAEAVARGEPHAKAQVEHLCRRFDEIRWQLDRMDAKARAAWQEALADLADLHGELRTR